MKEWDKKYGLSAFGTDIRIEWAIAIYNHGDWEKVRALSFVQTKAQDVTTIDPRKKYPADFRSENGVYVRSLSELLIANWLYANRIVFEYEREVFFPSCQKYAHSDFYLSDYDLYVEFWGMESDEQYRAYKQWKELLYAENGYKLMSLSFHDLKVFRDSFMRKLKPFEQRK